MRLFGVDSSLQVVKYQGGIIWVEYQHSIYGTGRIVQKWYSSPAFPLLFQRIKAR